MSVYLPKTFVCRPEPAYVTAGAEQKKPKDGQAKINAITTTNPPGQAAN